MPQAVEEIPLSGVEYILSGLRKERIKDIFEPDQWAPTSGLVKVETYLSMTTSPLVKMQKRMLTLSRRMRSLPSLSLGLRVGCIDLPCTEAWPNTQSLIVINTGVHTTTGLTAYQAADHIFDMLFTALKLAGPPELDHITYFFPIVILMPVQISHGTMRFRKLFFRTTYQKGWNFQNSLLFFLTNKPDTFLEP